jgi:hypothetical protein
MNFITGDMLRDASTYLTPTRDVFPELNTYSCNAIERSGDMFASKAYQAFLFSEEWLNPYGGTVLNFLDTPSKEEQQNVRYMLMLFIAEAIDSGDITIQY